jgi:hypothetical protein
LRINKKILGVLSLVGILSIGAGVGTYAAFKSSIKSTNNKIEMATYTINNKIGEQSFDLFAFSDAVPGSIADLKGFEAMVTGSKDMNIDPKLDLIVSKRIINNGKLEEDSEPIVLDDENAKYFEINTVVKFGSEEIFNSHDQFVPMKSFMDAINNSQTKILSKNQMFSIKEGKVRINSLADNDYQGASVMANLTLEIEDLMASTLSK